MRRRRTGKSLYGKFLLHFSILAALILLASIVCILYFMLSSADEEVRYSNQAFLRRAVDSVDTQLELINNYALRIAADGNLFSAKLLSDPINLATLSNYKRYIYPLDILDQTILYTAEDAQEYVYASGGIYRKQYFDACFAGYALTLARMDAYSVGLRSTRWFYIEETHRLVYAHPLAYREGQSTRTVFFIISADVLFHTVSEGFDMDNAVIDLLFDDFTLRMDAAQMALIAQDAESPLGRYYEEWSGQSPIRLRVYVDGGIVFARGQAKWLLGIGFLCLAAVVLVWWLSKRTYRPIGTLVRQLTHMESLQEESDVQRYTDLNTIRAGYQRMITERQRLIAKLDRQSDLIYSNILLSLLHGRTDGMEEESLREALHLNLQHDQYRLVYVMLDHANSLEAQRGRMVTDLLEEATWNAFYGLAGDGRLSVAMSAFLGGRFATMLLASRKEMDAPELRKRLLAAGAQITQASGQSVTLVLGARFGSLSDIEEMYGQVRRCAQWRILTGWNALIEQERPPAPPEEDRTRRVHTDDLLALCQMPDEQGATAALRRYFAQHCTQPDEAVFRGVFYRLVSCLQPLAERYGEEIAVIEPETVTEAEQYIGGLIRAIAEGVQMDNSSQRTHLCERAEAYLQEHHADAQLTPESLAEAMGVSPSYLQRTFKHRFGVTISVMLDSIRMDQVKRMLRESQLPLKEIIERAGYIDSSNFIRKFKRLEGETPIGYRKRLHQNG